MARRPDGYGRVARGGLVIVGLGIAGYAGASFWTPAYGGPLTGLGPAFLMIGAIGAMAVGAAIALIAFTLGAIKRSHNSPDR